MHVPSLLKRNRTPGHAAAIAATVLVPLLTSCASPGPPRQPSLYLPAIVTDLSAARVGDRVLLHWTTPARTTDNLSVREPLTADICRETRAGSSAPAARGTATDTCTVVLHVAVKPGASEAADTLPPVLLADPVRSLDYRVRILNPEGRTAGLSKPVTAPAGQTPAPVAALHATATRDGAMLEWQRLAAPSIMELHRSVIANGGEKPRQKRSAIQLSAPEPAEVALRSAEATASPAAADPGGTLDRSARRGERYSYRAQRLRVVAVDGKMLELRGDLSPAVTLDLADTFPPATPTGLASVPSASNGKAAIDLSWQPGTETDLAGYDVYRRNAMGGYERLNPAPVPAPGFTDTAVAAGGSYTYRVTAVDASGNESPPSAEVTETAQAPNR